MARNRKKRSLLKNKQEKILRFLGNSNLVSVKYNIYNQETREKITEQKAKKKKKNKKIWTVSAFVLNILILSVILIVQLTKDSSAVLTPAIDWKFMAVVIGMSFLFVLIDATKIFVLIKATTKKSRPFLSFKTSAVGKYYDAITPMATGGQPFQIFYMNKRGHI